MSEIAAGKVERNLDSYNPYWISVNDYVFANTTTSLPPDILLAPKIDWKEIQEIQPANQRCELILIMGDCPMERVLLGKL